MNALRSIPRSKDPTAVWAHRHGWIIEMTKGHHLRLTKDYHLIHTGATPGKSSSHKAAMSMLKRCERGTCTCRQPTARP